MQKNLNSEFPKPHNLQTLRTTLLAVLLLQRILIGAMNGCWRVPAPCAVN